MIKYECDTCKCLYENKLDTIYIKTGPGTIQDLDVCDDCLVEFYTLIEEYNKPRNKINKDR